MDTNDQKLHPSLLYQYACGNESIRMKVRLEVMEMMNQSNRFLETESNPLDKVGVDFMTNQPIYKIRYADKESRLGKILYATANSPDLDNPMDISNFSNRFNFYPENKPINLLFIEGIPKLSKEELLKRVKELAEKGPVKFVHLDPSRLPKPDYIDHAEWERRKKLRAEFNKLLFDDPTTLNEEK